MSKKKILIFIVVITVIVAVIRTVSAQNRVKQLKREGYGGGDREYSLIMEKDGRDCEVNITVNPKTPDEAELNKLFEDIYEKILTKIVGGNNSLSEVTGNLDFTYNTESGVTIQYFLDDYSVINSFGEVNNKSLQSPEAVNISVELQYGDKYKTYKTPVVVLPGQITEEEQINTELSNRINGENTNSDYAELPEEIDGKKVKFYEKKKKILPYFFAMFLIIAFLIYYYKIYNPKLTKEKRDKLLITDYPEIVSKLSLLMGAGMSTYNALIKITEDYKKTGKSKPAYEELSICLNRISAGIPETDAYVEFGQRCGVMCYIKLGNLLAQNISKGTDNIFRLLKEETEKAFEDRKALAKKLGEEAGTKLLLPMTMMLSVVLIIIVIPAFMSF